MGVLKSHFQKLYGKEYRTMNVCKPRRQDRVSTPQFSQAKRRKK